MYHTFKIPSNQSYRQVTLISISWIHPQAISSDILETLINPDHVEARGWIPADLKCESGVSCDLRVLLHLSLKAMRATIIDWQRVRIEFQDLIFRQCEKILFLRQTCRSHCISHIQWFIGNSNSPSSYRCTMFWSISDSWIKHIWS